MARQSRLEKEGIELRKETLVKNFYQAGGKNEYSNDYEDARTHNDENHPWGKGDPTYVGESYVIPDENKSKTEIKPMINTATGGGSYDKYGRNGVGGRRFMSSINLYTPDEGKHYDVDWVDTSINVNEYEQYTFNTRGNGRN